MYGWEMHLSPTGHWYYYNKLLNISTYDPPDYPVLAKKIDGHLIAVTRHGKFFCGSSFDLPQVDHDALLYLLAESRGYKSSLIVKDKSVTDSDKLARQDSDHQTESQPSNVGQEDLSAPDCTKTESIEQDDGLEAFDEPAFQDSDSEEELCLSEQLAYRGSSKGNSGKMPNTNGAEPEQDIDGFKQFLKTHADPKKPWQDQQDKLVLYDEFDLVWPKSRESIFNEWSNANSGSFTELVKQNWQPGLFFPLFKRKFKTHTWWDSEYNEKDKERIYMNYGRFSKRSTKERQKLADMYRQSAGKNKLELVALKLLD